MGKVDPNSTQGFFKTNIEFLEKNSLKKLKQAQQKLIDQARWNLAQPIMFKFSGIMKKYTKAQNFESISEIIFSRKLGSGIEQSLIEENIE